MRGSSADDPPAWQYLLSHHAPERWSRTLALRAGGRTWRLCTRCTGEVVGLVAWVAVWAIVTPHGVDLFSLPIQAAILGILPMAAALDWITQSLGRRESNSGLRLLSGALLGFAVGDGLGALIAAQWVVVALGVGVAAAYLLGLTWILWRSGAWRTVLQQHLPGIDVGRPE